MAYDASREDRFTRDPADRRPRRAARARPRAQQGLVLAVRPAARVHVAAVIYNSADPELIGIPFFYWYQMAWVPITVALTVIVYRKTRG